MILKDRRQFFAMWALDGLIILGSVYFMFDRAKKIMAASPPPFVRSVVVDPPVSEPPSAPVSTPAPVPSGTQVVPAPAPDVPVKSATRNILFTYRNSKALKVEVGGSFAPSPVAMTKGTNNIWSISVSLAPGEHTYNFFVDGKVIYDPNNPRTAPDGKSLLIVAPLIAPIQ